MHEIPARSVAKRRHGNLIKSTNYHQTAWDYPPRLSERHFYIEKTIFPFPFTLNGIWSWWQFSFRFFNQMEFHSVQNRKESDRYTFDYCSNSSLSIKSFFLRKRFLSNRFVQESVGKKTKSYKNCFVGIACSIFALLAQNTMPCTARNYVKKQRKWIKNVGRNSIHRHNRMLWTGPPARRECYSESCSLNQI